VPQEEIKLIEEKQASIKQTQIDDEEDEDLLRKASMANQELDLTSKTETPMKSPQKEFQITQEEEVFEKPAQMKLPEIKQEHPPIQLPTSGLALTNQQQ